MYIDVAELYFEPYASDFVLFESLMLELIDSWLNFRILDEIQ